MLGRFIYAVLCIMLHKNVCVPNFNTLEYPYLMSLSRSYCFVIVGKMIVNLNFSASLANMTNIQKPLIGSTSSPYIRERSTFLTVIFFLIF